MSNLLIKRIRTRKSGAKVVKTSENAPLCPKKSFLAPSFFVLFNPNQSLRQYFNISMFQYFNFSMFQRFNF